ncbi:nicotinate-nucleotide--dimethylbenzimidazole phosphoribosyltransferase [Catenuloplanes atrovinosus]|uniref:Adenosylcobinamide kinase n=1 Tax=Catenuloplanes atrovinosus TaxID=137266 RepID=A0AAE3YR41_9ACTN|nr:nicotinate-nucleotide--dimethylbenzimidazole phosphoribosyltransferase [Catenuloplanes atrovinosus]
MSVDGWNTLLVLGGIRSGKSEFAESLVSGATNVRYLATSAPVSLSDSPDDPEWAARITAHRERRPETWETDEVGTDPGRLITALTEAKPDETLLVDDLGGWAGVLLDPAHQPADDVKTVQELAAAVRGCAARLILVSPEVGLSLVPTTTLGRAFADAVGTINQAMAAAVDAVVLVVAGQPTWLKGSADASATEPATAPAAASPAALPDVPAPIVLPEVITPVAAPPAPAAASSPEDVLRGPTQALPMVRTGLVIQPNMELPLPDDEAGPAALDRLATLDLAGTGLGELAGVVRFAAATQGTDTPRPWQSVRVLLVQGDHAGGASAGTPDGESNRRTAQARLGIGALAQLTTAAGATLQVVDAPASAAIEDGPALTLAQVDHALRVGWRLAEEAVESGADLLVIAASGAGTPAAAAAVLAATAGAEPSAVLPLVRTPEGDFDDNAWMARCAAVRDAMQRVRKGGREAKDILAEVGGGDIAVVTGILLGATARRTPVLLDGPVGVAAALVSRDLAGQARHWCLLPDHNGDPAVKLAADVLGLTPVLTMRLDLGEGTAALAALPVLRSAIALAASIPPRDAAPSMSSAEGDASWPAEGLDATAAAGAASAGAAGLLAEAALSAGSTATSTSSSDSGAASTGDSGAASGDDAAVALASAVGVVTGDSTSDTDSKDTDNDTTTVLPGAGGSAAATTGGITPAGGTDNDTTTVLPGAGGSAAATTGGITPAGGTDNDTTTVLPGAGGSGAATTGDIARAGGTGSDVTTHVSGSGAGGAGNDATTGITGAGGTGNDGGPGIGTRGAGADTTAVITGAGGSDADETAVIRLPESATSGGAGAAAFPSRTADATEDDAERTAVFSVAPPADESPTTAFRVPPKDDPEATTVISTGGTSRTEDDEDSTSWLPGFGNPRRTDDPDAPTRR